MHEPLTGGSGGLRHRPMHHDDIREWMDLLANDPVLGPRYAEVIEQLPAVWMHLRESAAAGLSTVFVSEENPRALLCCGVSVVTRDSFVCDMKRSPFWIGPELVRRIVRGDSPLVGDRELREGNSHGGLNLVVWDNCVRPGYEAHRELNRCIMSVFVQVHQGYLWKEAIAPQAESAERLRFLLGTGALVWDPLVARYTATPRETPDELFRRPHTYGTTREIERGRHGDWGGTWAGGIFDYHAPRLGFSPREQELLNHAVLDATDEYLVDALRTSLPTVKKMWVSIYRRIEDHLPELMPVTVRPGLSTGHRGPEKRRRLLSYLRRHPEELRPYSRTLLTKESKV